MVYVSLALLLIAAPDAGAPAAASGERKAETEAKAATAAETVSADETPDRAPPKASPEGPSENGAPENGAPASAQGVGQPVAGMSLSDFADHVRPRVVHLKHKGASGRGIATGTGFVVAPGLVVTNHHVVDGAASVDVTFASGQVREAKGIAGQRPERDLAVLAIDTAAKPLPLGASTAVRQGERVIVLGNPQGLEGTLSEGIVSAVREAGIADATDEFAALQARVLQITAPISQGSSGSPVFNVEGNVIGVASAMRATGQNLNFVVPVEEVRALLDTIDVSQPPKPFRSVAWLNWVISAAFFLVVGVGLWLLGRQRKPKKKDGSVSRIH